MEFIQSDYFHSFSKIRGMEFTQSDIFHSTYSLKSRLIQAVYGFVSLIYYKKYGQNGKSLKNILPDIPFLGMFFYKFSVFHSPEL